jgi:hypothetical protein
MTLPDLNQWRPSDVILLVVFVGGILITLTAIVSGHWSAVRTAEMNAELKREMIQRGVPVADIERLLGATSEPTKITVAELVQNLSDRGHGANDLEHILQVLPQLGGYSTTPQPHLTKELADLIENLASNDTDGEGIARVLLAMKAHQPVEASLQMVERPT